MEYRNIRGHHSYIAGSLLGCEEGTLHHSEDFSIFFIFLLFCSLETLHPLPWPVK